MNTLTNGLDCNQHLAETANSTERLLVVAGPGTGKTQVSAKRLAHLINDGLTPSQILVLCFSRSAVRTLTRRIETLEESEGDVVEELRYLSIRTFDSWTFRLLRMSGFQPSELMRGTFDDNIERLVRLLEQDDSEPLKSFLAKIRHIVIDEAQDIGGVRLELVKTLLARLAPPGQTGVGFTILGDDAQAIYRFAARTEGAPPDQFELCMDCVRDAYGAQLREIELKKNYRASGELADAVRTLREMLASDIGDIEKLRAMEHFVGELVPVWDEILSPSWLAEGPPGSLALLTRTNGEALRVAKHLSGTDTAGPAVPVRLHTAGANSAVPAWVAALLWQVSGDAVSRLMFRKIHEYIARTYSDEICHSLSMPDEEQAWLRLVRACGLGDHEKSFSMGTLRERMAWPDAFPDDQLASEPGVLITTIHQSKGLEFENVVLLQAADNGDETEDEDAEETQETEAEQAAEAEGTALLGDPGEEASVLFVGVTRAVKHLGRLPRTSIYSPYRSKKFAGGRRRLYWWRNQWVNLEAGVPGDIDPTSFVDSRVHGSSEEVKKVQQLLLSGAAELRGRKVMLCKLVQKTAEGETHVHYNIHLQEGSAPGPLLGRTCSQLTFDLNRLLGRRFSLPSRIMNLRIGDIVSVPAPVEMPASIPEPWRSSGLWLGLTLWGTGDFRPFRSGR